LKHRKETKKIVYFIFFLPFVCSIQGTFQADVTDPMLATLADLTGADLIAAHNEYFMAFQQTKPSSGRVTVVTTSNANKDTLSDRFAQHAQLKTQTRSLKTFFK